MSSLFRRFRARWVWPSLACLCVFSEPLFAQESSHSEQAPWLTAFSLGLPGYRQQAAPVLFTASVSFTEYRPFRPALDVSLGTMPVLLAAGVAVLGVRAGGALPIALSPHVLILPSGGISLAGAAGDGDSFGIAGVNGGIALMLLGNDSAGLRAGVTWHKFGESGGALWVLEVGMVRSRK